VKNFAFAPVLPAGFGFAVGLAGIFFAGIFAILLKYILKYISQKRSQKRDEQQERDDQYILYASDKNFFIWDQKFLCGQSCGGHERKKRIRNLIRLGRVNREILIALFNHPEADVRLRGDILNAMAKILHPKALGSLSDELVSAVIAIDPCCIERVPNRRLIQAITWLPPMGGKVPLIIDDDGLLESGKTFDRPVLTAEQRVELTFDVMSRDDSCHRNIEQFSVQGRLGDGFKYVSIALALINPLEQDWLEPFFEADWAKVAPMIHDGYVGRQRNVEVNPLWKNRGRTDYLQKRINIDFKEIAPLYGIRHEILEEIFAPRSVLHGSLRESDYYDPALMLEARAYQRLALAFHAYSGSAPRRIPKRIRGELANLWRKFQASARAILSEYGLDGPARVVWFLDKPRWYKGWERHGLRYEAPYGPIGEALVDFETKRMEPETFSARGRMLRLLYDMTNEVDQTIGLSTVHQRQDVGDERDAMQTRGESPAFAPVVPVALGLGAQTSFWDLATVQWWLGLAGLIAGIGFVLWRYWPLLRVLIP
jgi:hypothetical protein